MGKEGKRAAGHVAFAQFQKYSLQDADVSPCTSSESDGRGEGGVKLADVSGKEGISALGSWDRRSSLPSQMAAMKLEPPAGTEGGRGSFLEYPEVTMIMQELDRRVSVLESISTAAVASAAHSDDNSGGGSLPPPQDGAATTTVSVTQEQLRALDGLGSNIKGLIRCLDHRHQKQMSMLAHDGDGSNTEKKAAPCPKQKSSIKMNSRTTKNLLRRMTSHSMSDVRDEVVASPVPRELLASMMISTHSLDEEKVADAAAYLANEYGGTQLPKRYTFPGTKRRGLKAMAKAMANANTFIGHAKAHGKVGVDELEYLPQEFSRLDGIQRKRLARLLSWEGLRDWGLDPFQLDRLSMGTLFRKSLTSTKNISAGATTERVAFERAKTFDQGSLQDATKDSDNMERAKRGCPLVLVGWAILASPYSQLAMAKNVDDQELIDAALQAIRQRANTLKGAMAKRALERMERPGGGADPGWRGRGEESRGARDGEGAEGGWNGGYFLPDEFEVSPRAVARFLRRVEREYSPRGVIPYHNNVHATDVMQTTHALLQMGGRAMEMAFAPLETYAILMAAACHDVRHPGTTNNYQVNKGTELALTYNDSSVLENMHASRASQLIAGSDEAGGGGGNDGGTGKILGSMTKEQQRTFRRIVIRSILNTDMSRHFSSMQSMTERVEEVECEITEEAEEAAAAGRRPSVTPRAFLDRVGGGQHPEIRDEFLPLLLHLADISNPCKPKDVSAEWTECVYEEFFLQGDREAREELPVSPLCDRNKTSIAVAMVGFMTHVVRPAYALLARCIPGVEEVVVSQLDRNLEFWKGEKARESTEGGAAR